MEELQQSFAIEVKQIAIDAVHNYMRNMLGEVMHMALSFILILVGILLFVVAITDSNILLGNPQTRDKSQLGEVEYLKFRMQLRVLLGVGGLILAIYNVFGFTI